MREVTEGSRQRLEDWGASTAAPTTEPRGRAETVGQRGAGAGWRFRPTGRNNTGSRKYADKYERRFSFLLKSI